MSPELSKAADKLGELWKVTEDNCLSNYSREFKSEKTKFYLAKHNNSKMIRLCYIDRPITESKLTLKIEAVKEIDQFLDEVAQLEEITLASINIAIQILEGALYGNNQPRTVSVK